MVKVTRVERLGEYRLRLTFSDGVVGDIDLAAELWGDMFEPLLTRFSSTASASGPRAGHAGVVQQCGLDPEELHDAVRYRCSGRAGAGLGPPASRGLLVDPAAQRIARHTERATDADNGDGARPQELGRFAYDRVAVPLPRRER